jgi:hypothetical protein
VPVPTAGVATKLFALTAVPALVVIVIFPDRAPTGTVAVTVLAETTEKTILAPATATAYAPARYFPVIVTFVPGLPPAGEKPEIEGKPTMAAAVLEPDWTTATPAIALPADAVNTRPASKTYRTNMVTSFANPQARLPWIAGFLLA